MNRTIRRAGIGLVALFVVVVLQLTNLQLLQADKLADDPRNVRNAVRDFSRPRGEILTADEQVVAQSVPSDDEFERQRVYPDTSLYAHTVGYQSFVLGNVGIEKAYNDELIGRDVGLRIESLRDLFSGRDVTGTVVMRIDSRVQEAARAALGDRRGSVVVLDTQTGGVVAMWSNPSFDPQPLAAHQARTVNDTFAALTAAPDNPMLPRAYRERYPPGSTFKVVTTALALDAGVAATDTQFPVLREYTPPQTTRPLRNFGGRACGGTLVESFVVSCNTTFAQLGVQLGEQLATGLESFGINTAPPPIDVSPGAVRSIGPEPGSFRDDQPSFAQAGIGQGVVAVTPLEMALVAQAVATGGEMLVPHVGADIRDPNGDVAATVDRDVWRRSMTPATAAALTDMMVQVVQRGTGRAAQIPGVTVAGKTGTAQADGGPPHAWFIAFAPAEAPRFAIAVIVERGGNAGDEATGGRVAAPIARDVLTVALGT